MRSPLAPAIDTGRCVLSGLGASAASCTNGCDELVLRIVMAEPLVADLLGRVAVEERARGKDVAVRADLHPIPEHAFEQPPGALAREAPPVAPLALVDARDLRHA